MLIEPERAVRQHRGGPARLKLDWNCLLSHVRDPRCKNEGLLGKILCCTPLLYQLGNSVVTAPRAGAEGQQNSIGFVWKDWETTGSSLSVLGFLYWVQSGRLAARPCHALHNFHYVCLIKEDVSYHSLRFSVPRRLVRTQTTSPPPGHLSLASGFPTEYWLQDQV